MLRPKPRSSTRAITTLNCWAIQSALPTLVFGTGSPSLAGSSPSRVCMLAVWPVSLKDLPVLNFPVFLPAWIFTWIQLRSELRLNKYFTGGGVFKVSVQEVKCESHNTKDRDGRLWKNIVVTVFHSCESDPWLRKLSGILPQDTMHPGYRHLKYLFPMGQQENPQQRKQKAWLHQCLAGWTFQT